MEEDPCLRKVVFTQDASEGLARCVGKEARKSKSKFYSDTESFKAAVTEVRMYGMKSATRWHVEGGDGTRASIATLHRRGIADFASGIQPPSPVTPDCSLPPVISCGSSYADTAC